MDALVRFINETAARTGLGSMAGVIGGVVLVVVGVTLSQTINSAAATSGGAANIGSFTGAQSLNDLVPLVYYGMILVGVAAILGGAFGLKTGKF
jgi:hypothetical protein